MAHITLPEEAQLPGIRGLMAFRPETARPLNELAEALLRTQDNTLSCGERELIATYVSWLNDCWFCQNVHGAAAQCYLYDDGTLLQQVKTNVADAPISAKMKTLLAIAGSVQKSGKSVTPEQVAAARAEGATDREIHDTVLIAAAFCLFNRYVDGLGTWAPIETEAYIPSGIRIKNEGYAQYDPLKTIAK